MEASKGAIPSDPRLAIMYAQPRRCSTRTCWSRPSGIVASQSPKAAWSVKYPGVAIFTCKASSAVATCRSVCASSRWRRSVGQVGFLGQRGRDHEQQGSRGDHDPCKAHHLVPPNRALICRAHSCTLAPGSSPNHAATRGRRSGPSIVSNTVAPNVRDTTRSGVWSPARARAIAAAARTPSHRISFRTLMICFRCAFTVSTDAANSARRQLRHVVRCQGLGEVGRDLAGCLPSAPSGAPHARPPDRVVGHGPDRPCVCGTCQGARLPQQKLLVVGQRRRVWRVFARPSTHDGRAKAVLLGLADDPCGGAHPGGAVDLEQRADPGLGLAGVFVGPRESFFGHVLDDRRLQRGRLGKRVDECESLVGCDEFVQCVGDPRRRKSIGSAQPRRGRRPACLRRFGHQGLVGRLARDAGATERDGWREVRKPTFEEPGPHDAFVVLLAVGQCLVGFQQDVLGGDQVRTEPFGHVLQCGLVDGALNPRIARALAVRPLVVVRVGDKAHVVPRCLSPRLGAVLSGSQLDVCAFILARVDGQENRPPFPPGDGKPLVQVVAPPDALGSLGPLLRAARVLCPDGVGAEKDRHQKQEHLPHGADGTPVTEPHVGPGRTQILPAAVTSFVAARCAARLLAVPERRTHFLYFGPDAE